MSPAQFAELFKAAEDKQDEQEQAKTPAPTAEEEDAPLISRRVRTHPHLVRVHLLPP